MVLGLVLTTAATLWLSTRPNMSTKARMLNSYDDRTQQESTEQPVLPLIAKIETEQSNTPDFTVRKEVEKITHTIREGETLSGISQEYYGSENKWQKILNANRNVIRDANKLKPGTKLIIPE